MLGCGPALAKNPYDDSELTYNNQPYHNEMLGIFYFTSFYIFLNISALPVLTLVLRNNLIFLLSPKNFPSKEKPLTKSTFSFTILILALNLMVVLTCRHHI